MATVATWLAFVAVYELSRLLNTGLDRKTLEILMMLLQRGVNPEALASVVKQIRRDAAAAGRSPAQPAQQQLSGSHTSASSRSTSASGERMFTGGKQPPPPQQETQDSQVRVWFSAAIHRPKREHNDCGMLPFALRRSDDQATDSIPRIYSNKASQSASIDLTWPRGAASPWT